MTQEKVPEKGVPNGHERKCLKRTCQVGIGICQVGLKATKKRCPAGIKGMCPAGIQEMCLAGI